MPYMCCVLNCPNSVLNPNRKSFTFHRFPKDEISLRKWVKNINRENFVPTKHTRVCSGHFDTDSSYNIKEDKTTGTLKHRKSLRADAIPTIFDDGPPIQKKMHKIGIRKPKKKQVPTKNESNLDKNHSMNHNEVMSGMNGNAHIYNNNNNNITNNNNTPHSQSMEPTAYHTMIMNGTHSTTPGDYDPVSTTNGMKMSGDRGSPAESDTYELTELTPVGKQDRLTPLSPAIYRPNAAADPNSLYHRSGNVIGQGYQHLKEVPPQPLGGNVGPLESSSMLNGTDIATYADVFKKCVISESFLYTLLRLVKCPQCGYGVLSEQMLKYESQGCLLGVRLPCYNGHLVLDWRL